VKLMLLSLKIPMKMSFLFFYDLYICSYNLMIRVTLSSFTDDLDNFNSQSNL